MPDSLPVEILEEIIDIIAQDTRRKDLKDLLSLCICAKVLVPRCQKYIFREVIIYPANDASACNPRLKSSILYRKTVSLASTIRDQPHLALHVQILRCKLTTALEESDHTIRDIAKVVVLMRNVHELTLGFEPPAMNPPRGPHDSMDYSHIKSNAWNAAIIRLIRSSQLRLFSLHNTYNYPQVLLPSKGRNPRMSVSHSLVQTTTPFGSPESMSTVECEAEALHLTTYNDMRSIDNMQILRVFRHLRSLDLTLEVPCHVEQDELDCILKELHPSSLTTLTHLTVRINTRSLDGTIALGHPFGWRWAMVLSRLRHLRVLKLHFCFQGLVGFYLSSLGLQWAVISNDLTDPGVCPQLSKLAILVDLRIDRGPDAESDKQLTEALFSGVKTLSQNFQQLLALKLLLEGRVVTFSFEVSTSIGPFLPAYISD